MTDTTLDAKQMAEIAARYAEFISNHDIEAICRLFAVDAMQEDPVGDEPRVGIASIREFFQAGSSHILRAELGGSVRCGGNTVAFPLVVIFGDEGSEMKLEAIDVFEFNKDGKIQSMKAYWGADNCSAL